MTDITLSYTMYPADVPEEAAAAATTRLAAAPAERGNKIEQ